MSYRRKLRKRQYNQLVEELSQEIYASAYAIDADGWLSEREEELKKNRDIVRTILKEFGIKY